MENQRENTMVVSGFGSATVVPDEARLQVSVEVTDRDPAAAYRNVGVIVDRVLAALDAAGVGEPDRRTTTIELMPQTRFDGTDHVLSGYTASHALRLRIVGMSTVTEILDVLVDTAGDALRLHHDAVVLACSGTDEARARAEVAAVADARARAQRLAEAAEASLGPVLAVREETVHGGQQNGVALAWRAESSGGPVQAGVETVGAAVQVTFALR